MYFSSSAPLTAKEKPKTCILLLLLIKLDLRASKIFNISPVSTGTKTCVSCDVAIIRVGQKFSLVISLQEIFPAYFGSKYDASLEMLVWEFISRLDELLPVPDFTQVP